MGLLTSICDPLPQCQLFIACPYIVVIDIEVSQSSTTRLVRASLLIPPDHDRTAHSYQPCSSFHHTETHLSIHSVKPVLCVKDIVQVANLLHTTWFFAQANRHWQWLWSRWIEHMVSIWSQFRAVVCATFVFDSRPPETFWRAIAVQFYPKMDDQILVISCRCILSPTKPYRSMLVLYWSLLSQALMITVWCTPIPSSVWWWRAPCPNITATTRRILTFVFDILL